MFTPDVFLTVINMIYKNLFNYQPSLDNRVTMKIKI